MVTGATSANRLAAQQPPRQDRSVESKELDQQDFLQLIIAQMRNQNPLEPQSNTEFIAQIAQFSMLEQLRTLNESISALQTAAVFSQASALLGKTVLTKASGSDDATVARLEPSDGGAVAAIAGLPPADSPPGTWNLRTEADGSVEATFTPANGAPPATTTGRFDAEGKLEGLIPGVTIFVKVPHAGGADRITIEPMSAGTVERIVMQNNAPKLLVDGQLVDISDVLEVRERAQEGAA